MTDTAGGQPPFPGFPGFPPAEMLDNMWGMMRLTPFGAAFPGMQSGAAQGFGGPLSVMQDLMKPLMNVEELDKRITDMRAVEQWLKLNLNMLQSAIQALEVQRATLSTLSAFGAFAQASMSQPAETASGANVQTKPSSPWGSSASTPSGRASDAGGSATGSATGSETGGAEKGGGEKGNANAADDARGAGAQAGAAAFDPSGWWNLLQSQFNQLAAFAMTQPGAASPNAAAEAEPNTPSSKQAAADNEKAQGDAGASASKPAAKRPAARKNGAKSASPSGGAARGEK